jgi:hypothetical protein
MRLSGITGAIEANEIDEPVARQAAIECLEGLSHWVAEPAVRSALAALVTRLQQAASLNADKVRELAAVVGGMARREEEFQASLGGAWG